MNIELNFVNRKRLGKSKFYINLACLIAKQSTCDKRKVGCVITTDDFIVLATGYNGSISGEPHCDDVGCLIDHNGKCIRTIHAEQNAVAQAARIGNSLNNSYAFVSVFPCLNCFKILIAAGVKRIYYNDVSSTENFVQVNKFNSNDIVKLIQIRP